MRIKEISCYDITVCDIDNTLISGWMTDLMDWTWEKFQSPMLGKFLGKVQQVFHLYKINHTVVEALKESKYVYFLTARGPSKFLAKMLENILPPWINWELVELGSSYPPRDKQEWIFHNLYWNYNVLFIDDNYNNRRACRFIAKCISPGDIEK